MHFDGCSILDKYLSQQHSRDLTSLYVGVGHEMTLWAIWTDPTKAKALLFWSTGLGENVALSGHLAFYTPTKGLSCTSTLYVSTRYQTPLTVIVSHNSACTS